MRSAPKGSARRAIISASLIGWFLLAATPASSFDFHFHLPTFEPTGPIFSPRFSVSESFTSDDDLATAVQHWLDRVYAAKPTAGHSSLYETPYRKIDLGDHAVAMRVIVPSETIGPDTGQWYEFDIIVATGRAPIVPSSNAASSGVGSSTGVEVIVSDFRSTKRAQFLSDTPSFGLQFSAADLATEEQMEKVLVNLIERYATQSTK